MTADTKKKSEKAPDRAVRLLIQGILDGTYPPGSDLPGERDLCKSLGVARPALREALQRLSHDGWLIIQQGKPTRVSLFMRDGSLNVLIGLLQADITLLPDFVTNLLDIWALMAPAYAHDAIAKSPQEVHQQIYGYHGLADRSRPYARAQWRLHRTMIALSGNPVFGLILNSFYDFYMRFATYYLADPSARAELRAFWESLDNAVLAEDAEAGADITRRYMYHIRERWPQFDIEAWVKQEPEEDDTFDLGRGEKRNSDKEEREP